MTKFKVGDKVRVKEEIKDPHYNWGLLRYTDYRQIGIVKEVVGVDIIVDFPCQSRWRALQSELEKVGPLILENK